ncbi:MAG: hypothetical protein LBR91_02455 [Puniceicoccales bacterium]|nr:hypothetical protein [Puniceicoccales bacterium]
MAGFRFLDEDKGEENQGTAGRLYDILRPLVLAKLRIIYNHLCIVVSSEKGVLFFIKRKISPPGIVG